MAEQGTQKDFVQLREILVRGKAENTWDELVSFFEDFPEDQEPTLFLEYASQHVKEWDDSIKHVYDLDLDSDVLLIMPFVRSIRFGRRDMVVLPDSFFSHCKSSQVKRLDLRFCKSLSSLVGLERLKHLEEGFFQHCSALEDITALAKCKQLRKIDFSSCSQITDFTPLSRLPHLEYLLLDGCNPALLPSTKTRFITKEEVVSLQKSLKESM